MENKILTAIEAYFAEVEPLAYRVNRELWSYAEPSGQEFRSAACLAQILREHGFSVRENICGRPTALVAEYGAGHPVIGILGEYDALPGLSQKACVPEPSPIPGQAFGHGCGHCALGSGSLAAVLVVQRYLKEHGCPGTIRFYGCCSEETDGVKPWMAREGYFDDVDCVFAWHPGSETGVPNSTLFAMQSFRVTFERKGTETGNVLSACALMNVGANYLRGRVPPKTRIHYAYLDGEEADGNRASLMYVVRAPKRSGVEQVQRRLEACAQGAAKMAGVAVRIEQKTGYADRFQNPTVARILSDAALTVGSPQWSMEDYTLARAFISRYDVQQRAALSGMISRKYPEKMQKEGFERCLDDLVEPFDPNRCVESSASSDVGDVGYAAPTASMRVACAALATPAHSWFLTGMIASPIGEKGIACAAKILSLAAVRVCREPGLLAGAQEERLKQLGESL